MRIFLCLVFWLASTLLAFSQDAESPVLWKEVGGWRVFADRSNGNACFMASAFEGGAVLRVGFNGPDSQSDGYLAIGNLDWTSIEVGKDYPISFQMDREPPWTATAQGWRIGEFPFLLIENSTADFFVEFARKLGIKFFYQGKQIAHLSLRGTYAGLMAMLECQAAVDQYLTPKPSETDPFKEPSAPTNPKDPFA